MATTIKQTEGMPASYPVPWNLSPAAQLLPPELMWQRLEAYIAHRYSPRSIVWVAEGEGEWIPPLSPATITAIDVWENGQWISAPETSAPPSPVGGYSLTTTGPYRFTGTVGGGTPPDVVFEAYRRLAEYFAEKPDRAGASSYSARVGPVEKSYSRNAAWAARVLENSGAGDLLRP